MGKATAVDDYGSILNRSIDIPANVSQIFETIQIQDDGFLENNETFFINVTSSSAPHLVTRTPAATRITIIDNDGKDLRD